MTELQPLHNAINELRASAEHATERLMLTDQHFLHYTGTLKHDENTSSGHLLPSHTAGQNYAPGSIVEYSGLDWGDMVKKGDMNATIKGPLRPGARLLRRGLVLPYSLHFLHVRQQNIELDSVAIESDPNSGPLQERFGELRQITTYNSDGEVLLHDDESEYLINEMPHEVAQNRIKNFVDTVTSTQQIFARIALSDPSIQIHIDRPPYSTS